MHYYLFDDRATNKMPVKQLAKLISQIKTSPVAGQQTTLRSPQQLIEQAKSLVENKKNPTVVAVGDDMTLDLVLAGAQAATAAKPSIIGFVPTTTHSYSAKLLKLRGWQHAISELPKRRVESFDSLKLNSYYILSRCSLEPDTKKQVPLEDVEVRLDNQLDLTAPPCKIVLTSLSTEQSYDDNPSSLKIEAYLSSNIGSQVKNKEPIIETVGLDHKYAQTLLIRLKANQANLKLQNTYLIGGVLPISKDIAVSKAPKKQDIIMSRDSDPLSRS